MMVNPSLAPAPPVMSEPAPVYWYPLSIPTIGEEEIAAVVDVMRSGKTTMGEKVEEFEEAFARYVDSPYAIMVNSGSSADLLAARAIDTTGEVIIPAVTWPTHVWGWEQSGGFPKFCDVDGINTNSTLVMQKLTMKTRVVSLPHLMGVPIDPMDLEVITKTSGIVLHEDCCEALGARFFDHHRVSRSVGYWADVASWSFFFSHQMTTMEGGMVTTPHRDVNRKVRSLRSHGWNRHFSSDKYTFHDEGFNLRPSEVNAAIGLVQLTKLDAMNAARTKNYEEFARRLRGHPDIVLPSVPENVTPSWFGVPMFVAKGRDSLAKHLEENGVETRPILAGNLRNQQAFRGFYFGKTPGADRVQEQGLFVGLHPTADSGPRDVCKLIGDFL